MRIAYIAAGAAGMYCGSCLQDNTLAAALIRKGHDVALIPTYTPIRTDETDVSIDRVFYGAVNVYLEQKTALFRHTPWLVDRVLNGERLLNWASSRGASVDAGDLGALTLSVLSGEHGNQKKELDKLVAWLRDDYRPDLVHLTNSMMLGLARGIKQRLGVPVLCSVQGEDLFLDGLSDPYHEKVHVELRERAKDADAFVAPSRYYVEHMARRMQVPAERIHQVNLGLNLEGFGEKGAREDGGPFVVGYLARICPEKGLHLLIAAFKQLVDETGANEVRLRIAGYLGPRDRAYLDGIMDQVRSWGLAGIVEYVGEVDRKTKSEFLTHADVLSVPTTYREPKGRFVLEALAHGTPVVQPRHGAFPEMIDNTGGGLLVDPESPGDLARGLRTLMDDPDRRNELGRAGRQVVHREYDDGTMAERTLEVYRRYVG